MKENVVLERDFPTTETSCVVIRYDKEKYYFVKSTLQN